MLELKVIPIDGIRFEIRMDDKVLMTAAPLVTVLTALPTLKHVMSVMDYLEVSDDTDTVGIRTIRFNKNDSSPNVSG